MTNKIKAPGVYVVEINTFPNSVVTVATAVPAFIGYTEKAGIAEQPLLNKPKRISSLNEYRDYFGMGPPLSFAIGTKKTTDSLTAPAVKQGDTSYYLTRSTQAFNLYSCLQSFFQNGGGPCYVVSVGDYGQAPRVASLIAGIETLIKEPEPTLVVIPDAVLLDENDCAAVQAASLAHCGALQSRFAILDVFNGYKDRADGPDCIDQFRSKIGNDNLDYGAAYYPWIETTIVQDGELSFRNIDKGSLVKLQGIIAKELIEGDTPANATEKQFANLIAKLDGRSWSDDEENDLATSENLLHERLFTLSKSYDSILNDIQRAVNLLPPSAAMAGVYTMVDDSRGVWKAPANVSLNGVIRPAVDVSHDEQEDLNVNAQGKSINAIRSFVGKGTLVWGARTLDGNSLDWRYINIRRTVIMLEQSMKLAMKACVFEANDANTWSTMKSLAQNFLTGIWRRGGLAGASPDEAFSVHVGLGKTMTPEDILEGILRITVLVAPTRPAEFIEITFQQKMQQS